MLSTSLKVNKILGSVLSRSRFERVRSAIVALDRNTIIMRSTSTSSGFQDHQSMTVERGILFSAPCLDPRLQPMGEKEEGNAVFSGERGILFSAPCLDPRFRDDNTDDDNNDNDGNADPVETMHSLGQEEKKTVIEKGVLFSSLLFDPENRETSPSASSPSIISQKKEDPFKFYENQFLGKWGVRLS